MNRQDYLTLQHLTESIMITFRNGMSIVIITLIINIFKINNIMMKKKLIKKTLVIFAYHILRAYRE
ncbi:unnamed protein product [Meloidogyne enterolobii]|uniref:Uncharacterized protein n=1 Tax=Meloidogyne enterolobii TaxID=390850 RepID=A0ACB0ZB40_MELEN